MRAMQVRTTVKDDNDLGAVQSFLDSDGTYNNNNNRTDDSSHRLADGLWHMYTLTTHTVPAEG